MPLSTVESDYSRYADRKMPRTAQARTISREEHLWTLVVGSLNDRQSGIVEERTMTTQCPSCSTRFRTSDDSQGKKAQCLRCKQPFVVMPYVSGGVAALDET